MPTLPLQLRITAFLFIALGIIGCAEFFWKLSAGRLFLSPTPLYFLCGIGLLRLRPAAHLCSFILFWLQVIGIPLLIAVSFLPGTGLRTRWWGSESGMPLELGLAIFVLYIAMLIWTYAVLMSPQVKALFAPSKGQVDARERDPARLPDNS